MLLPYILRSPLIHKLVLFDQPPYAFTFHDPGYKDQCIALSHSDQLTAGFCANIQAFPVQHTGSGSHAHIHVYICIAFTYLTRIVYDNIYE